MPRAAGKCQRGCTALLAQVHARACSLYANMWGEGEGVSASCNVQQSGARDGLQAHISSAPEQRPSHTAASSCGRHAELPAVPLLLEAAQHSQSHTTDLLTQSLPVQLLEGIAHLHGRWVFHRDLKPSNLLMGQQGQLKICDFGLARYVRAVPDFAYTPGVVSLWYRSATRPPNSKLADVLGQ